MDRDSILRELGSTRQSFDFLVIGGGATGLGAAWDAATRGYRTLLVERSDFAQATSSRSTKLIHGGVRYLKQLNVSLVRESLEEREYLIQHAPDLVQWRQFVIPLYHQRERLYYAAGLKLYDALAGKLFDRGSSCLSRRETLELLPGLNDRDLVGGISYWDGQFDDSALAISLAAEIQRSGGQVLNYVRLESFIKERDRIVGAVMCDVETDRPFEIRAKIVINATGVFSDSIRNLDLENRSTLVAASRGSHIVLPADRVGGDSAMMLPKTRDGRVLFAIPWQGRTLVGTTDIPVARAAIEPTATNEEIEFLLAHANEYLNSESTPDDILSCFAGLRPLVRSASAKSTAALPRDHHVERSASGLITVVGGKWTTFRKMAEDTVDVALQSAELTPSPCRTSNLTIHAAWKQPVNPSLDPKVKIDEKRVRHAVENEFARTVSDILSRRTRTLLLDARAAIKVSKQVGSLLGDIRELNEDQIRLQIDEFRDLAHLHLPPTDTKEKLSRCSDQTRLFS